MKDTTILLSWFAWAILNFAAFAYNMEYNRNVITWIWLLTSIISFIQVLRYYIKIDNKKKL